MHKNWVKPTHLELNNTLNSIANVHNLNVYNNSELVSFIRSHSGLSRSCVYRFFCSDSSLFNKEVKQIKLSHWIFLNILANNDLDELFDFADCELFEDTESIVSILGVNAFKSREHGFVLPCADSMDLMFFKDSSKRSKNICNMKKVDFTDSICINYNVFSRAFSENEMIYINFKLYLLTLGFSIADIGIFN